MRIAFIGSSGHVEYAIGKKLPDQFQFVGWAPCPADEQIREDLEVYLQQARVRRFSDWKQMLDDLQPEAAVINPQHHMTGSVVLECLERQIHVFVEKPVTLNLEELVSIENSMRNSHLMAMHYFRYQPAVAKMMEMIQSEEIGEILQIVAQKSYKMGEKPDWMRDRKKFGGIIPWVGAHVIDQVYGICGDQLMSVSASATTAGNKNQGDVQSSAVVFFELKNGGQAVCHLDYLRPEAALTHGDDRIRVAGSEGVLEIRNKKLLLNDWEVALRPQQDMFADFLNSARYNEKCRVSAKDSIEVTRLCLLAQKSAESGEKITL